MEGTFIALSTIILVILLIIICFYYFFSIIEEGYSANFYKPFFVHFYSNFKKLNPNQLTVLRRQFVYFNSLSVKEKKYFEHRVASFIYKYEFIGRENFEITVEVKVLIAATSVMLTFGMRNYLYEAIDKIIVYPSIYFSEKSNDYHKGEFNPLLRAIVFSWEDFKVGYDISNDNLNLGIHEFVHVLHFECLKKNSITSAIFVKHFNSIKTEIKDPLYKEKLIKSNYFRIYAYTNDFEFLAVIIEHFFESQKSFKIEFPLLYFNIKKMLNSKN